MEVHLGRHPFITRLLQHPLQLRTSTKQGVFHHVRSRHQVRPFEQETKPLRGQAQFSARRLLVQQHL